MQNVTVKVADLLDLLKKNRDRHKEQFELAGQGYWKKVNQTIQKLSDKRNDPKRTPDDISISIKKPVSHLEEYDTAIEMLKMHIGETFELSKEDFQNYAMDKWEWKRDWTTTNSGYWDAAKNKEND